MSEVQITYLQQLSPQALQARPWPAQLAVALRPLRDGAFNARMYRQVGGPWQWTDRLGWSAAQWQAYAQAPTLHTWTLEVGGETAGYAELQQADAAAGAVQLAYFGLLPQVTGRGWGGPFLSAILEKAWSLPATRRVWVHTCTLDHPAALANYQARGMTIFHQEIQR